jgi:hypothetical protein
MPATDFFGTGPEFPAFFLEDQPRSAFFSAAEPFSKAPIRRRFFQNQFDTVFDQYLAALGAAARTGVASDQTFADFSGNFDFNRLFQQQPRFQRGVSSQFFNPKTRFLFGF